MRITFILLALSILSCQPKKNNESAKSTDTAPEVTPTTLKGEIRFKSKGVQTIYSAYASLRDALVETDFEKAKTYADELQIAFEKQNQMQHASIAGTILESAEIELAREAFFTLNENMEDLLSENLESGQINKVYCPMARDNQGGSWFTAEAEIENPYFGDKMLKCGSIKATYKK